MGAGQRVEDGRDLSERHVMNTARKHRVWERSHDVVVVDAFTEVLWSSTAQDPTVREKIGEDAHDAGVADHVDAAQLGRVVVQRSWVLAETNRGRRIGVEELHRAQNSRGNSLIVDYELTGCGGAALIDAIVCGRSGDGNIVDDVGEAELSEYMA